MGILQRIFEKRGAPAPTDDFWYQAAGNTSASGVMVTPETAMRFSAVYACVRVISETVASLPLILYRRRKDGGKDRATDHPLYGILHDMPNLWQTSLEFREMQTAHVVLRGNAYAEILSGPRGAVDRLVPLHPDRVKPYRINTGRMAYQVQNSDGTSRVLTQDEIFHVRGLSLDGVSGLSPIAYEREAIGLGIAAERFGSASFSNGARPGGVLTHPGKLTEEASKRLKKSWDDSHSGTTNAHKTALLEEGMKWEAVSMTMEDAQFLESRKFQLSEVARIFRVPPHMIGDLERATFSNIEHQSIDFVVHTIRPWLERWEQCITRDLLTERDRKDGIFAEFLVDGLLRGDVVSRYTAYAQGRQNGWLSANDIRSLENMNPVDGGDIYLVPLNMVPADQAGQDTFTDSTRENRVLENREERSIKQRHRIKKAHERLFKDAAERVVKREVAEIRTGLKKLVRGTQDFESWMRRFYEDFEPVVYRNFLPVVQSMAESIFPVTAEELGAKTNTPESVMRFADDYTKTAAVRYVASSRRKILKELEADPQEVEDLVSALLDGWAVDKAERLAQKEAVQSAGAIARESYKQNGVVRLRWITNGDSCPICQHMNGKIVSIQSNFMEKGDTIDADGAEPLTSKRTIKNPPIHGGCDCSIAPA